MRAKSRAALVSGRAPRRPWTGHTVFTRNRYVQNFVSLFSLLAMSVSKVQLVELGRTQAAHSGSPFTSSLRTGVFLLVKTLERGSRRDGFKVAENPPYRETQVSVLQAVGGVTRQSSPCGCISLLDTARHALEAQQLAELSTA